MKLGTLLVFMICFNAGTCIQEYYMELNCGRVFDFSSHELYQIRLKLTSHTSYKANTNCTLYLQLKADDRFMLYFKYIMTASCKHAWLDVFDSNGTTTPLRGLERNCGTLGGTSVYTTTKGVLTLNFVSDDYTLQDKGFDMVITAFHTGSCYGNEYLCDNGRCIDDSLKCNGYNPCGDNSDYCPLSNDCTTSNWENAAKPLAGISACLSFIIIVMVVWYYKEKKGCKRGRTEQEPTETTSLNSGPSIDTYQQ